MIKPAAPRGRPPKDPVKLAIYNAAKNGKHLSVEEATSQVHGGQVVEVKQETDAEIVTRISDRFDVMQKIAKGACQGNVRAVIVSGAGGVGKTYTIEEILQYHSEKFGKKTEVVRGVVSPVSLYCLAYKYRDKDSVLVLDDADAIFYNEDSLAVLKACLDTNPVRKVSWMSQNHALKQEEVPNTFLYEGTMIFITNIDMQSYVDVGKTKLTPHMQALMTRALYLDLKLHTPRELMAWVTHVVSKKHILVQHGLDHKKEQVVLEWLANNHDKLRELSLRTAIKVANTMQMSPSNWESVAETLLCK